MQALNLGEKVPEGVVIAVSQCRLARFSGSIDCSSLHATAHGAPS